jgi:hypothetical protein
VSRLHARGRRDARRSVAQITVLLAESAQILSLPTTTADYDRVLAALERSRARRARIDMKVEIRAAIVIRSVTPP